SGPNWFFDIDALIKSMNYKLVVVGTKACDYTGKAKMETVPGKDYILLPLWPADPLLSQNSKSSPDAGFKSSEDNEKKVTEEPRKEGGDSSNDQEKEDDNVNSTNNVNVVSSTVIDARIEVDVVGTKTSIELPDDPNMPELEDIVYSDDYEDVGAEADMKNDPKTRQKVDFKGPIPRMTPAARIKAIDEFSKHSFSWYKDEEYKKNDFDKVLKHINDFEHNISVLNEEVRMVKHQYKTLNDDGGLVF
ncbi:hypothetical protein Tco_0501644, partial [Tanacetum coccineum]